MGDGAFSNVYKAVERKSGRKVAVKVVRKYELNSSQVRILSYSPFTTFVHIKFRWVYRLCVASLYPGQVGIKVTRAYTHASFLFASLSRGYSVSGSGLGPVGQSTDRRLFQNNKHLNEKFKKKTRVTEVCYVPISPPSPLLAVAGPRASGVAMYFTPVHHHQHLL
jgi:serine/threonine protein kinase